MGMGMDGWIGYGLFKGHSFLREGRKEKQMDNKEEEVEKQ